MATRTVLVDDMDGGPADVTIAFTIESESYSLDLSNKNADLFWAALEPFLTAAAGSRNTRMEVIQGELAGVEQRAAVRAWARKQGFDVADRGRIPADIQEAFDESHRR